MKKEDWEIIYLYETGSTNDVAQQYSHVAGRYLVIRADKQTAGRGRRGRNWQSLVGNLFFSLLLKFELHNLGALAVMSSLSLLEAVKKLDIDADVLLKWPNDVLLNGGKLSGILLEKADGDYMVCGIGVNVEHVPDCKDIIYRTASLKQAGICITAADFLDLYLEIFTNNLNIYDEKGFAPLRQKWLDNAKGVGENIVVRQENGEVNGRFVGLDENANLLLEEDGAIRRILAGDVFIKSDKDDRI